MLSITASFAFAFMLSPLPASAQRTTLLQLPQPSQPLYDGRSRLVATRFTNGEVLTAQHTPQRDGGFRVVMVRYSADGRELRRIEGGRGRGFGARDQLSQIIALADGGALVSGMTWGAGRAVVPYLLRLTRDDELAWRMSGVSISGGDDFFATWSVVHGDGDEIFLHGFFKDGSFQLPGERTWRPRRTLNPFMARVDANTGRLLWAKRVRSDGEALLQGQVLSVISVEVPRTHHGDAPPAFSVLRVDRYDLSGRRLGRTTDRLPGAAALRSASVDTRDGGFAIATETCRDQDSQARCLTEGIVYFYDARGARIASHDVPAWSVMARRSPGAPIRVIGPSAVRRVHVGSSWRNVADEVEVLTFANPTERPTRARIAIPNTRFVSVVDSVLFGGESTAHGLFLHSPSALLEPGTADRGQAGDTLLFIADASFRPVDRLPVLTSDPYPPPREEVALNPFF